MGIEPGLDDAAVDEQLCAMADAGGIAGPMDVRCR
jgi:hypothetical protein